AGLRDSDTWIREAAAGQIVMLSRHNGPKGVERSVPGLMRALDDPDTAVQGLSISALQKLTGNPWHARLTAPESQKAAVLNRWKSWWQKAAAGWPAPAEYRDVPPRPPSRSDPAPDFALTDIDGKSVSLAEQRGKVTLLNFWGSWCGPCQREVPGLA